MESFAPKIKVHGGTVTPKSYEWVLGFALAGCEWAIEKASEPEFLEIIRAGLKKEKLIELEDEIKRYECQIGKLQDQIKVYA